MTTDGDLPLPEPSDVERRLLRLERDMSVLTLSTARLHTMQAYADRDIAEWRQNFVQQNRVINALRQTQVEHSARFDRVEQRLDRLGDRFEGRLDGVDERLEGMDRRLGGVDERLEGMDRRLGGVDERLEGMDQRLEGLTGEVGGVKETLARLVVVVERLADAS